ncbi:MAG TPA: DMT family transporter [Anaerovoracaceae bacterium]|nr:DMT family transporter [Anaerovoracaceae bacterium]
MGELFALGGAVLWASSSIFARKAQIRGEHSADAGVFLSLVVNCCLNILALAAVILISGPISLNWQGIMMFAGAGLFNTFLGRLLYVHSINLVGASRAGGLKGLSPFVVVLGGIVLLSEKVSTVDGIGIAVLLSGVIGITVDSMKRGDRLYHDKDDILDAQETAVVKKKLKAGILIGVFSAVFFGAGNLFRKAGLTYIPSPFVGSSVGALTSILFFTSFMLARGQTGSIKKILRHPDPNYALFGVCSACALFCVFLCLNLIPVTVGNSILTTEPVFTMIFSMMMLGKRDAVGKLTALGCFLIMAGAMILIIF